MKLPLNVKLGIAAGLVNCLVWYGSAKAVGFYSLEVYGYKFYTTLLLLLSGIFVSIYFERKSQKGFIEFKLAMKTGLLFSVILSVMLSVFSLIYHKLIVPDAIDFFVSEERKAWLAHNRTLEEVNKYLVEYYIPTFGAFHTLMTTIIWGILLTLLSSAILRKKNPMPPFSEN